MIITKIPEIDTNKKNWHKKIRKEYKKMVKVAKKRCKLHTLYFDEIYIEGLEGNKYYDMIAGDIIIQYKTVKHIYFYHISKESVRKERYQLKHALLKDSETYYFKYLEVKENED